MTRLLVDYSAGFSQGAGIGRYARSVVPRAVTALPEWETTLVYAAATRTPPRFHDTALAGFPEDQSVTRRRIPFTRRRLDQLWFRARLPIPIELFAGRSDIVYSPDFTAPPTWGCQPRMVTVHDLAFMIVPDFAPAGLRAFLGATVPRQARKAALIAVVSETTRNDVMERLGVEEDRIVLVRNGVDERFFGAPPLQRNRRDQLGIPARYLLTVGTLEPRKNHLTLFKAMEALRGRVDLPLVIAGGTGWEYDDIVAEANRLQGTGDVIRLDYVPDWDLPGLYAGAAAVIYPSWYEGFGLPVLEALASGAPVVSSNAPALVEVGGVETITVDPGSAEAFAAAIERALESDMATPLAAAGRIARARTFGWDASGDALAAALRRLEGMRP